MTEYTDEQRARAHALHHQFYQVLTSRDSVITITDLGTMSSARVKAWLELEEFILQSHTCKPVWRQVTFNEIQAGWEVRGFDGDGAQATWGIAHDQSSQTDWLSKGGYLVAWRCDGWSYETTAPMPKPEPDPSIEHLARALHTTFFTTSPWEKLSEASRNYYRKCATELRTRLDALEEGEQS